jgi:hypothetical protein
VKATIEHPTTSLALPALYRHTKSDAIHLIDQTPPNPPGGAPTPRYRSTLLVPSDKPGSGQIGMQQHFMTLADLEPFTGRLILENDK